MNKPKERDFVNYVVVGSRYQVLNEKGEAVPEFGVGRFRNGIHLELAMNLYTGMAKSIQPPLNAQSKALARQCAAGAFALSEVFLDEMDKHLKMPPPPENNNNNSGRK